MKRRVSVGALLVCSLIVTGCGGGKSNDGPSTPTPTNQNPSITNISVTPSFGVVGLVQLALTASATDPDGDPVTFQWTIGSTVLNGANQTIPIPGDGPQTARLSVSDGKGGTATATRDFASGTMTGTWRFTIATCGAGGFLIDAVGSQTGGTFTGSAVLPAAICQAPAGTVVRTDPGAPGTITPNGAMALRLKVQGFADIVATGTMDTTGATAGRRIAGTADSLDNFFRGEPFIMNKQ